MKLAYFAPHPSASGPCMTTMGVFFYQFMNLRRKERNYPATYSDGSAFSKSPVYAINFTSWLGLSLENKISGEKKLSSKTRPAANKAEEFFRIAAFSLNRSQTVLGGFYRRIKAKQGTPKAITATARKIAVIFYTMLTKGVEYLMYYENQYRGRLLKALEKPATDLGYILTPISSVAPKSIETR